MNKKNSGLLFLSLFIPTADIHADVLCAPKSVKVTKGAVPLGTQIVVRSKCRANEVRILNAATFVGPEGPAGAVGATGAQGPVGATGAPGVQGLQGIQGVKGEKGETGDIGPQGPTGATGAQGIQGVKGDRGPQGPAGGLVPWVEVTTVTQMESNTGYIVSGGDVLELTLPDAPSIGDVIEVHGGADATGWRIVPGVAGQTIDGLEGLYGAGKRNWADIAVSSDGSRLAATTSRNYIYTSADGGATWTERTGAGSRSWSFIVSSSAGLRLAATGTGSGNGFIYTSADGGETWTERTGAGSRNWYPLASSADGLTLCAAADGVVYRSVDGGETWNRFLKGIRALETTASGRTLFGAREVARNQSLLYSSALDTFEGLQGDSDLKLIYLGNGVFGRR